MKSNYELGSLDIKAIESLYNQYKKDPKSVDESLKYFFEGFELASTHYPQNPLSTSGGYSSKESSVIRLITGYRRRGHFFTKTNPVRTRRSYSPTLDLENFGLSEKDLDTEFEAGNRIGLGKTTLRNIVEHLEKTYCGSIGVEYRYMTQPDILRWLQEKMESTQNRETLPLKVKKRILDKLIEASVFEDYLHKKFVGQKRFSLEGSEAIIPAIDAIMAKGGKYNVNEIVIGMAHRGRLNVLTNIMKKPYSQVFLEFNAEHYMPDIKYGDVKYHLGYNNKFDYKDRKISMTLAPNPSHLEAVAPVIQGIAKAKLENEQKFEDDYVLPILIHGDAAIAGQGVVYETIQFSKLEGYRTGGTIHIVINNQVGFTTNYLQGRSSTYCTDVAKVTKSPVFHVNGDDVEAMAYVAKLALEFRQKFNIDVFIDVLSYRKYGHNEGDEPRFTQPKLYDVIAKHKNPRDIYAEKLIKNGDLDREEYNQKVEDFRKELDEHFEKVKEVTNLDIQPFLEHKYKNIRLPEQKDFETVVNTKISKERFLELAKKITTLPKDKNFFKKTIKLFAEREKMIEKDRYDWAMGELMAYASLAKEMHTVRLSGQDSQRGTFSHRHAQVITEDGEEVYCPLRELGEEQGMVKVLNSPLSEYGVLGFEYGYSLAHPDGLTIWEAQFGDFYNVAQVIIDQYISSAQEKWRVKSGLVMLLPHGYEGQGAEHSSGRIERFLGLCANNNLQVINPTTPANLFHALRRQLHRDIRVPLIIFSPKSLLRHPECTSSIADFTEGCFQEIIKDKAITDKSKITKLILCTGKIYYELNKERQERKAEHISIVRIEQLYPFAKKQFKELVATYNNDIEIVWVQEEPKNMGAGMFIKNELEDYNIGIIARLSSGVTAEGLSSMHKVNQQEIIEKALK